MGIHPIRVSITSICRSRIQSSLLGLAFVLTACATPTPYQPADGQNGYVDQQIETDRFKISFGGNFLTDRETVENYLLFRASEITLANNKDYFVIVDRSVEETKMIRRDDSYPEFGFYSSPFHPEFHSYHWARHRHSFGQGFGYGYSSFSREYTRYKAFAEIRIFRGKKPADDVNAYAARDVIDTLRAHVTRPAPNTAP